MMRAGHAVRLMAALERTRRDAVRLPNLLCWAMAALLRVRCMTVDGDEISECERWLCHPGAHRNLRSFWSGR